jgi:hydroxypyruvate isomerase
MSMTRRKFIRSTAVATTGASLLSNMSSGEDSAPVKLKGNINHSVCRWCYSKIKLDDLCAAGKDMGLVAIDLLNPPEFETVKKHDLICSMVSFPTIDGLGGITKAWNRVEHHDKLVQAYEQRLKETADAGFKRLICFSGNRAGLDDEKGMANCAAGMKRILPLAE